MPGSGHLLRVVSDKPPSYEHLEQTEWMAGGRLVCWIPVREITGPLLFMRLMLLLAQIRYSWDWKRTEQIWKPAVQNEGCLHFQYGISVLESYYLIQVDQNILTLLRCVQQDGWKFVRGLDKCRGSADSELLDFTSGSQYFRQSLPGQHPETGCDRSWRKDCIRDLAHLSIIDWPEILGFIFKEELDTLPWHLEFLSGQADATTGQRKGEMNKNQREVIAINISRGKEVKTDVARTSGLSFWIQDHMRLLVLSTNQTYVPVDGSDSGINRKLLFSHSGLYSADEFENLRSRQLQVGCIVHSEPAINGNSFA